MGMAIWVFGRPGMDGCCRRAIRLGCLGTPGCVTVGSALELSTKVMCAGMHGSGVDVPWLVTRGPVLLNLSL